MAKEHPAQKPNGTDKPPVVAQPSTPKTPLEAELDRLRAENEALKRQSGQSTGISLKVSEKGALSCYGMGRFPVTLYREQWEKLLAGKDEILGFIAAHDADLKKKEPRQ